MKKVIFLGLLFVFIIVGALFWRYGKKPHNTLTTRESIALTNAVRRLTDNPIVGIGFSSEDHRAFVTINYDTNPPQNLKPVYKDGFIFTHTYDHGSVFSDGFMFELTETGWNYLPIPPNEPKRK